jgi:hypothetical protein
MGMASNSLRLFALSFFLLSSSSFFFFFKFLCPSFLAFVPSIVTCFFSSSSLQNLSFVKFPLLFIFWALRFSLVYQKELCFPMSVWVLFPFPFLRFFSFLFPCFIFLYIHSSCRPSCCGHAGPDEAEE